MISSLVQRQLRMTLLSAGGLRYDAPFRLEVANGSKGHAQGDFPGLVPLADSVFQIVRQLLL